MIKPKIDNLHLEQINRKLNFSVGDTVKVHYKISEGNKERIQLYEGVVIAIQNEGAGKTFNVRRISYDVGVERIFPLYAPTIDKIEVVRSGRVRRSKLYYLREKIGKDGRLKEIKRKSKADKLFAKADSYQKEAASKKPVEAPAADEAATEPAE